jgi:cell fate regulator YaaT (PSP1 superfamily)
MIRVVSIKFRDAGRLYDFDAGDLELSNGDQVVVETERGRALGLIVTPPHEVDPENLNDSLKKVLRKATDEDLAIDARYKDQEQQAFEYCKKRIEERGMEMKLVRAEYLFEGSKVIFYFTADGRVDFRELVKDLAHNLHTRIEMRQIGVRDEAKLLGGVGVCGRELCCCTFLREFNPVSVKMAKEQGLALNPGKISGQCGRLLCCLGYEYETYCHLRRGLPKIGRIIKLGNREAMVLSVDIFAGKVKTRLDDGKEAVLTARDIELGQIPDTAPPAAEEAPPRPAPKSADGRQEKEQQRPKPDQDKDQGKDGKADQKRQADAGSEQKSKRKRRGRSSRGRGRKKEDSSRSAEKSSATANPRQDSADKPEKRRPEKSAKPDSGPGRTEQQKGGQPGQLGGPDKPRSGEKKRRPRRRSRKKDQ